MRSQKEGRGGGEVVEKRSEEWRKWQQRYVCTYEYLYCRVHLSEWKFHLRNPKFSVWILELSLLITTLLWNALNLGLRSHIWYSICVQRETMATCA